jgi:hypothetical protein
MKTVSEIVSLSQAFRLNLQPQLKAHLRVRFLCVFSFYKLSLAPEGLLHSDTFSGASVRSAKTQYKTGRVNEPLDDSSGSRA